ncbi:ring-1,2-phenylacetyl-CoA epoxidase subunit PaaC [Halorubrum aquaticum]|uniref:Ring-1,2-phenylacetyl-CoA epoxidase subunit PaaC n=1 Tax=Halorubrum aquaticum TaxID=387340 RepID=A0A1I3A149_9EURY|nr:Phenylacetic acid catabolic protein [Halorubrum aquaticum]SFH43774.1 ring-1,2-phenylacetyl-CoA epoxidase subunit PaaC [Halorubrum aquaticum]
MSEWPAAAVDYVQAITDTKLVLGHRYAQWSLAGPSLEDDIGGSSAAQEEVGHVRQLFRKLESQGRDGDWLRGDRDPEEFANASCLDAIDGDWTAYMATIAPVDRAAWYMLDAIDREDMEGMITKMGEDEYFHLEYHDARLETLAAEDPETLQSTLEETIPSALALVGPEGLDDDPLVDAGFTNQSVADVRERFIDHYRDLFAETDVSLEGVDWDAPDADAWDETRRRVGEGGVRAEDLVQIRGERNAEFAIE